MPISHLKIFNARNLIEFSFNPGTKFNILYGDNGTGKTTILESIYFLSRAKTFRSNNIKNFVNHKAEACVIYSEFENALNKFQIGIKKSKLITQKPVFHLNKKNIKSVSEISQLLFLTIISPSTFLLLDADPLSRRKYIDWGVFHVEHEFINVWKEFNKTLLQRNSLLKNKSNSLQTELKTWNQQLNSYNDKMHNYRKNHVHSIFPYITQLLEHFSHDLKNNISFQYMQGWPVDEDYLQIISTRMQEDIHRGFTRYGSHRSDLKVYYKDVLAKNILSRGQSKIVILCMMIAQIIYTKEYFAQHSNEKKEYVVLLDDLDSELDFKNIQILLSILDSIENVQYFITTTDVLRYDKLTKEGKELFHVEHINNSKK